MGVSTAVSFGPMTGDDEASNGGFVLPFKVNGVEVGVSSSCRRGMGGAIRYLHWSLPSTYVHVCTYTMTWTSISYKQCSSQNFSIAGGRTIA